jgi:transcription termination factor Rho
MDDMIYEEFKGTGNMELHLSRRLAERRVYPAFDVERSGTRREELLLSSEMLPKVWTMRRMLSQLMASPPSGAGLDQAAALELLLQRMARTDNNTEFLDTLHREVM